MYTNYFNHMLPQDSQQSEITYEEKSNTSNNQFKKIIFFVIIILITAGTAFGAWYGYETYVKKDPYIILWQAIDNFQMYEKMEIQGSINISNETKLKDNQTDSFDIMNAVISDTEQNKTYGIEFKSRYDLKSKENPQQESVVSISWNKNNAATLLTKLIDKILYIKIEIPETSPLSSFIKNDFAIPDTWLSFDKESTQGVLDLFGSDYAEELENRNAKTKQILTIVKQHKPFDITVLDTDDQSLGVSAYKYKLTLNRENYNTTLIQLIELIENPAKQKDLQQEFSAISDEDWANIKDGEFIVWVTKSDTIIKKLEISHLLEKDSKMATTKIFSYGSFTFVEIKDDVIIEKPLTSISVIDYYEEMSKKMMSEAKDKSNNAKIVSDIKSIQTALEIYYVDEGKYPNTTTELNLSNEYKICSAEGFMQTSATCTGTMYMGKVPTDPNGNNYTYQSLDEDQNYELKFYLSETTGPTKKGYNIATKNGIFDIDTYVTIQLTQPTQETNTADSDNDGLTDYEELVKYKTDPNKVDTDGDGYYDGLEVENGYNPNGPN